MTMGLSRRLSVFGAVSVLLATFVAVVPRSSADDRPAVAGPSVAGSRYPARSTIPHLSQRLAALAEHPVRSIGAQARITATAPTGPGSLLRQQGTGRLLVDIRVARWDAAVLTRLRSAGARITHREAALHTVTAAVVPSQLLALSRVSGVQYMTDIPAPQTSGVCDSVISEGDQILHAAQERANASVDGTGVTVGILSDSFDTTSGAATHASDDVTSDNLPGAANTCGHTTPVNVLQDYSGGGQEDEGRAMAQIVHDLAPGAKILFATAEGGMDVFADNIRALADAGADIIVDDVSYFAEPFYQDGPIAVAVNDVRAMGVDYFSSAANNNIIVAGHDVASYEAVGGYRSTTCPASLTGLGYTDCHNFNGASGGTADPTFGLTTAPNRDLYVVLDWAEPEFGVKTDYALCILNADNTLAFPCSDERNPGVDGSQLAFESTGITTGTGLSVVVARYGGNTPNTNGKPRFKLDFLTNSDGAVSNVEYPTPTGKDVIGPVIYGHNGTSGAVSTAASDVRVSPSTVTSYSSHGPVTLLYGPVDGTTPAARLSSPQVLAKPDLTASHCGVNTFFGSFTGGQWRFCGTSAAAPHAAAVAALLLQQNPELTPARLNDALTGTATDLGLPHAVQGAGLIDAAAAGANLVPRVTTKSLPSGVVGKKYAAKLSGKGGNPPFTWRVTKGKLPAGLSLAKSGTISGTPSKAGSFSLTVTMSDSSAAPVKASKAFKIKIAPFAVRTATLPAGTVGKKYSATLKATGGKSPLAWTISSGKLPGGLSLARSGAISGKPAKKGTYHVTVRVTDSAHHKASKPLKLVVKAN